MIRLVFITGSAIRRVHIKDRIITLLAAEIDNKPLTINLDQIDSQQEKLEELIKKGTLKDKDIVLIKELSKLGSEKEIARDIINDFQSTGWRLMKTE